MKLFIIQQFENLNYGAIVSCLVAANNPEIARLMHPETGEQISSWEGVWGFWCKGPSAVKVTLIGEATPNIEMGVLMTEYAHNE